MLERRVERLKIALRQRMVHLLEDSLHVREPEVLLHEISARLQAIERASSELEARARLVDERLDQLKLLSGALLDDTPRLRRHLEAFRAQPGYDDLWDDKEPLISVRIATYNLAELLVDRALASVRRQTYERYEVIVVGDACTDDTERRVRAIGDPRIHFVNLPTRAEYPDPPHRQMVAGAPCMNLGAQLASGVWLAPLDDDDEFEPDHLECLLARALEGRFELAYGNIRMFRPGQAEPEIYGKWPPTYGAFGYQAAIYLTGLRFFEYDTRSWLIDEPADMTLRRRMLEAGVRMGWLDKVVTTYYPSLLHRPSRS